MTISTQQCVVNVITQKIQRFKEGRNSVVIVAAGAIGCGKSSLATLLADYYGSEAYPLTDSDIKETLSRYISKLK